VTSYQQSLVLEANPAAVYAALTTPEGLRAWWTPDCDVQTATGGKIHLRFERTHKEMRIERLDPGREVRWLCTASHLAFAPAPRRSEWVGTQIVFRLTPHGMGHTRLDFEHVGLVPALDCYEVCSDGWRHYLSSLQQLAATGRGTPYEPRPAVAAGRAGLEEAIP
jgi:uncharacterized protein YndB with AHSA1/START domain